MNSTTKSKLKKRLLPIAALLLWVGIWELAALLVGNSYLLPDVPATLRALFKLFTSLSFYKVVSLTLIRVLTGLTLGVAASTILAVLADRYPVIYHFLAPLVSVIKSTPVASFIIILWVLLNGNALAIFIAFLMVFPIVWQNLMDGFKAIDVSLLEVCTVFELPFKRKMKCLVFPTLIKYFVPAVITASGLAWKSEIAAEIIAYTKSSIGEGINDARFNYNTPEVFAWTLIVIIFSISLEKFTKHLLKKVNTPKA